MLGCELENLPKWKSRECRPVICCSFLKKKIPYTHGKHIKKNFRNFEEDLILKVPFKKR
jgi:hypothetical protein